RKRHPWPATPEPMTRTAPQSDERARRRAPIAGPSSGTRHPGRHWMLAAVSEKAQDGAEGQDDDQRCHCVGDEGREKDAADHQLGKGMHHAACSTLGPTWRSLIAAASSKYDRASLKRACCCGPALVAAASWAIRTASRNIASSGAHWRSRRDSTCA